MADVFLSYAREDLPFVRRLTAALQDRNRDVWVDLDDIIPSARWMEEICTGIIEADAVAFIITPDSVASEVCSTELDYATQASKRLVPILARQTPRGSVPPALAELHWLSFLEGADFEAGVDRLVEIMDTDIDRVHLHTRLLTQASKWESRDRDRSLLLRGGELKEAETWLANQTDRKPAATPGQAQLILASRRAATRRQRGFGFTGVVVAVVMAILATGAFIQRQTAVHERQIAEDQKEFATVRGLAAQAEARRGNDPRLAPQLGIAAYRIRPSVETGTSLYTTLTGTSLTTTLTGHTDSVGAVAFSPDGQTLATASRDETVGLWDITDRAHPARIATLAGSVSRVNGVAFSPDGHTLATVSGTTAGLWDVTDRAHPARIATLTGHTDWVSGMAFSVDGQSLATARRDESVGLWDVTDRSHPVRTATLTDHTSPVEAVAFHPNGQTMATASTNATVGLWDITDRVRPVRTATLTGPASRVVVFSPDGHILATVSNDNTVELWDVTDRTHPVRTGTLTGHTDLVDAVAFSPDGDTLATASWDKSVGLWKITDRAHPRRTATLTGHASPVVFSPDGRTLATASSDNMAALWMSPTGSIPPAPPP